MTAFPPQPVTLTKKEAELRSHVEFDPLGVKYPRDRYDVAIASGEAVRDLMHRLLERLAIPEIRLAYFTDPELNIPTRKSRRQEWEENNPTEDAIFEHPNFAHYLKYFLEGPDLPADTLRGFCRIANDESPVYRTPVEPLQRFVRAEIRRHRLDRSETAEEFSKLALETGFDVDEAKSVRTAALQTR